MKTSHLGIAVFATLIAAGALRGQDPSAALAIAGLGDMEKITKDAAVPPSPHFWDANARRLTLHGGRNETVAAQLMLGAKTDVHDVDVTIGDLKGAAGVIPADPYIQRYLEIYQYVANGGYGWGPPSKVLPSKLWYPEILAPFRDPYAADHKPVGAPFTIATSNGPNQGVWIDVYIPKDAKPGTYEAPLAVTVAGKPVVAATLKLTVHAFTLSDEFHVDGYGEIYGVAYGFHKAGYRQAGVDRWWEVAGRYHQMAHQHRFVISEREGSGPSLSKLDDYDKTYGTLLDGSLFTSARGYVGPGANTGIAFWRAPFGQYYDGKIPDFTDEKLKKYMDDAKAFWDHCVTRKWDRKRFFAYIIDEAGCDARCLANERKLQDALDASAGLGHIRLIWTSHTDPETLAADPATDKRSVIHWWSANGGGCNPEFLRLQMDKGDIVWFYLPCWIWADRMGSAQIQMVVPIAATALETADLTQDESFLAQAYEACSRWDRWLSRHRNTRGTGLCEAFCEYDTGHDNSPRFKGLPKECPKHDAACCPATGRLPFLAPDLSATVYGGRRALAAMATRLGKAGEAAMWGEQAETIRQRIVRHCYDPADECFYDVDADGAFVKIRGDALTRVLGEHVVDQSMFERIYARQIRNPEGFWPPFPLPSIAVSDPAFVHERTLNSWGGPSQALTALRAPRWLEHYGKHDDLNVLMQRWVGAIRAAPAFMQQMDPWTGEFSTSEGYSPAMCVFLDFVDRLGLLAETQDI